MDDTGTPNLPKERGGDPRVVVGPDVRVSSTNSLVLTAP